MKFVTARGSTIPRARGQGMGAYRLGALHALRAPLLAVSAHHTRRYMTRRMPGTAALATAASSAAGQSEVPKSGDVLTLECTSLAFGGRGVCKLPGGFVVFCDRAVPGETLEARVTSLKGGGRFAEATKVSSISPCEHRTAAPCPHFERCGGCTWQDIAYAHQLTMKRDQVVDVMTRVAKVDQTRVQTIVGDCVPSDKTERYRNKMEFAFGPGANGRGVVIGLRPSGNHSDLVEIGNPDGCLLQHPVADEVLRGCRAHLDSDGNSLLDAFNRRTGEGVLRSLTVRVAVDENGEAIAAVDIAAATRCDDEDAALRGLAEAIARVRGVASVVRTKIPPKPELRLAEGRRQGWVKGGRGGRGGSGGKESRRGGRFRKSGAGEADGEGWSGEDVEVLSGAATLPMKLRGVTFALSAPSFFQTNTDQAEKLVAAVEDACGFSGDGTEVVLDLFCGVGTLGLCVAKKAKHVFGWEVVPEAVKDAERNAEANGITNATFRRGDLAKLKVSLPGVGGKGSGDIPKPDIVIADPARAGMDESLVKVLRSVGAERIVYVSCNPATQARDLLRLKGGDGGEGSRYDVRYCTPVDMFPHTPHVETVVVLDRISI